MSVNPVSPTPADTPTTSNGNIWARLYTEDGYQISLTLPVLTVADALRHMNDIRAAGLLPAPVEPPSTEETETITTVVRREFVDSKGNVIPVIDLYPEWRGQYGQFRFTTIYLDTAADIAQFEAHAGVKVDALPFYESDAPLKRKAERPHRCETKTKPFVVVKKYNGDKEVDGKVQRVFKFSHYVSADGYAAAAPKPVAPASQPAPAPTQSPAAKPTAPVDVPASQPAAAPKPAANSNPFLEGGTRNGITAALKAAGFTNAPEDIQFLFSNIVPGVKLGQVSDAHAHITPDEFLKRIPQVAAAYKAHLEAQTQPDPDDDPTPTNRWTSFNRQLDDADTTKPAQPMTGVKTVEDKDFRAILGTPHGSSTRPSNPLIGERVQIHAIELAKDRKGFSETGKWWGYFGVTTAHGGVTTDVRLTIWPEDARKIKEAGYAIDFPTDQTVRVLADMPAVILEHRRSCGLAIRRVEPAESIDEAVAS